MNSDLLKREHKDAVTEYSRFGGHHPATIIARPDEKTLIVREDIFGKIDRTRPDCEVQPYGYFENTEGDQNTYTLRVNGRWVLKGQNLWSHWYIRVGIRHDYRDPNWIE